MSLWIKWDANAHKDATLSSMSDTAFRAFIVAVAEAKQLRSGGRFKSRAHLRAIIGSRLGRAIPQLLEAGLLTEDGDGVIAITNYSRYQVDPTSSKRQRDYVARLSTKQRTDNAIEQSRAEQNRNPQTPLQLGEILRRAQA